MIHGKLEIKPTDLMLKERGLRGIREGCKSL